MLKKTKHLTSHSLLQALLAGSVSEEALEDDQIWLTKKIAYQVVAPIIISLGILGNLLTLIILSNKSFKGVTYSYFFALAISDTVSLLLSISASVHLLHPITRSFVTACWYSYAEVPFVNGAMGTSVLIVVCITIDRYFSVCRPYQFKIIHTKRNSRIGIGASLIVSVVVWLPVSFLLEPKNLYDCDYYNSVDLNINETLWVACYKVDPEEDRWYDIYAWIREVVIVFIPVALVLILNSLLLMRARGMRKSREQRICTISNPLSSTPSPNRLRRDVDERVMESLLKAIMISFFLTLLPAGVFFAAFWYDTSTGLKYEIFQAIANDLQILNHASNFYLYVLLSKPIREVLPNYARTIGELFSHKFTSGSPDQCLENAKGLSTSQAELRHSYDSPRIITAESRVEKTVSQHTTTSEIIPGVGHTCTFTPRDE